MRKSLRFLFAGSCFVAQLAGAQPQEAPADSSAGDYWYYCDSTHTYYPYFPYYPAQCPEGWPLVRPHA